MKLKEKHTVCRVESDARIMKNVFEIEEPCWGPKHFRQISSSALRKRMMKQGISRRSCKGIFKFYERLHQHNLCCICSNYIGQYPHPKGFV